MITADEARKLGETLKATLDDIESKIRRAAELGETSIEYYSKCPEVIDKVFDILCSAGFRPVITRNNLGIIIGW